MKRMVSLVEVHPSESIRLKVLSTVSSKISLASAGKRASVKITQSIVAKAGANIPAPFAMPLTCTPFLLMFEILGTESVVIIACAQSNKESLDKFFESTSNPLKILSIGKNSPIIPVEHTKISDDE